MKLDNYLLSHGHSRPASSGDRFINSRVGRTANYTVDRRILRKYLLRYLVHDGIDFFPDQRLVVTDDHFVVLVLQELQRHDVIRRTERTRTQFRALLSLRRAISLSARAVRDCSDGFSPDVKMSRCPWHGARKKMDDRELSSGPLATARRV